MATKTGSEMVTEINREYRQWRHMQLSKPASERARNMNIPRIVWMAHTGSREIPANIQEWIIGLQESFLLMNPRLVYANPICYKSFVPRGTRPNYFLNAGMRLVDRICAEDKHHSNYGGKNSS